MNKSIKYIALPFVGLALAGCSDLDTKFDGMYVSPEQKEAVLEANPEMAKAGVLGMPSSFNTYMSVTSNHYDFGYPGVMMMFDSMADDMPARYFGYNWFWGFQSFASHTDSGNGANLLWNIMYSQILTANSVISSMSVESENPEIQIMLAQGYAFRAFNYWVLAQCYQRNYDGHQNDPCVPLLTDENSEEVALYGAPRASVEETYALILSDINTAITLAEKSGLSTSTISSAKPRRLFNVDALYGLRARINLTMHKYAEAAADADKVISISSCSPLTIDECSKPGFNGFDHSWLWGDAIAETDRVVTSGIVNFPSMICSFANGYVTVGAWRCINAKLYEETNSTDVRRGWFLDSNYESPILSDEQRAYLLSFGKTTINEDDDSATGLLPYMNVKFDSYKSELEQTINASDIPMMRIEEMYYIKAEAQIMSGSVSEGVNTLVNFVTTYRDPSFSVSATDTETLQDIIWKQRRIEFWGEGLSWFDLLRLNKGLDRVGGGFPAVFVYQTDNSFPGMLFPIPQSEMQYNKQIGENNPATTRPTPVKE